MNKFQVGRFAEYFAKMEFALYGYEIFTSEVDDRGIDFVVRFGSKEFLEIQVKSARDANYIFMQKTKFPLRPSRYLALVMLQEDQAPDIYLIPSTVWLTPNSLFVDRNYEGLKSKPEWGVSLNGKTRPMLLPYKFETMASRYMESWKIRRHHCSQGRETLDAPALFQWLLRASEVSRLQLQNP